MKDGVVRQDHTGKALKTYWFLQRRTPSYDMPQPTIRSVDKEEDVSLTVTEFLQIASSTDGAPYVIERELELAQIHGIMSSLVAVKLYLHFNGCHCNDLLSSVTIFRRAFWLNLTPTDNHVLPPFCFKLRNHALDGPGHELGLV